MARRLEQLTAAALETLLRKRQRTAAPGSSGPPVGPCADAGAALTPIERLTHEPDDEAAAEFVREHAELADAPRAGYAGMSAATFLRTADDDAGQAEEIDGGGGDDEFEYDDDDDDEWEDAFAVGGLPAPEAGTSLASLHSMGAGQDVEVTLDAPQCVASTSAEPPALPPPPSAEEAAALKAEERRLKRLHNARRRALAEGIHRVGLLCWLSHGRLLSEQADDAHVQARLLALVPSELRARLTTDVGGHGGGSSSSSGHADAADALSLVATWLHTYLKEPVYSAIGGGGGGGAGGVHVRGGRGRCRVCGRVAASSSAAAAAAYMVRRQAWCTSGASEHGSSLSSHGWVRKRRRQHGPPPRGAPRLRRS